jgi:hypothetical protein
MLPDHYRISLLGKLVKEVIGSLDDLPHNVCG